MNSATLERLISNLGCTYGQLVADGIIPVLPLEDLYDSETTLEALPEDGMELCFWAEDQRLEAVQLTLEGDEGEDRYTGELPTAYRGIFTKLQVRSSFGKPLRSVGPMELPGYGLSGGWDCYQIPNDLHSAAQVDFQYQPNQMIKHLVFALIDRN